MRLPKRVEFLYWLRKIANVPEAEISPLWIKVIYTILFPVRALYAHQKELNFDILTNTITIGKCRFSMFLFDQLSQIAKEGDKFEFVSRYDSFGYNYITIKKLGIKPDLHGEDFYNLMQSYRMADMSIQDDVVKKFEEVKLWIMKNCY